MSLNLRLPCEHDQCEEHPGRHSHDCLDEPSLAPCVCDSAPCPGGRVLTDAEALQKLISRYGKRCRDGCGCVVSTNDHAERHCGCVGQCARAERHLYVLELAAVEADEGGTDGG